MEGVQNLYLIHDVHYNSLTHDRINIEKEEETYDSYF